ncbi:MAG: tagatose-bisphosphate aldolase, partial [Geminicoccaceae bacterium]|nr:tagatose-bisphosphate aldolase [Geminicoccaceae bacterium]
MEISAGKLWGLRRLADDAGRFKMTAMDQRPPIIDLVKERRGLSEAPYADVVAVKRALAEALTAHSSAVLLDPDYAYSQVIDRVSPRQGVLHTLEDHAFDETPDGRRSAAIRGWSVSKIKRAGGDAVKLLIWYRPDAAPAVRQNQRDLARWVGEACQRNDLPFVLEMLLYPLASREVPQGDRRAELVLESVRTFAAPDYEVDLLKLESPVAAAELPDPANPAGSAVRAIQRWYDQMGELAGRPWVMLSAGAGKDAFKRVLTYGYRAGASGFLAGRAIWWRAFERFPDLAG